MSLPCDSLIELSQRPMTEKVGIPGETDISISDITQSVPLANPEYTLATDGFPDMALPPL